MKPAVRLRKATELFRARQTRAAIDRFMSALEEDPSLYEKTDDDLFAAAMRHYAHAAKSSSGSVVDHFRIGLCRELKGEFKEAKADYEAAVKRVAKGVPTPERLARHLKEVDLKLKAEVEDAARQEAEARRANLDVIRKGQHPTMAPTEYLDQGRMFLQSFQTTHAPQDFESAEAYLSGAIAKSRSSVDAHLAAGQLYLDKARTGEFKARALSRRYLDTALRLNPAPAVRTEIQNALESLSSLPPR
jgi:tetratricopeptide (TPR) repeat protein